MACLLFDENLSPHLALQLAVSYPDSQHVRDLGLLACPDHEIWDRAKAEEFTIVTKDDDFSRRSFLYGAPPKVIWLVVAHLVGPVLRGLVAVFLADPEQSLLVLRIRRR